MVASNKFYLFRTYPLEPIVNSAPGDLLSDSSGDIYYVDSDFNRIKVIEGELQDDVTLEELTEIQYKKLYCVLIINKLVSLGYVTKRD